MAYDVYIKWLREIKPMAIKFVLLPIFDTAEHLGVDAALPQHLSQYQHFEKDYLAAHAFLSAYKDNNATYNAYRREVERLLHWAWQKQKLSIFKLRRAEIEAYIHFCQKPPKQWIGLSKPPRFLMKNGLRQPNPDWRPFVATVSKSEGDAGIKATVLDHQLSEKAVREIFAVLSSFYQFSIQEDLTEVNPISLIRQKSKFIRRQQGPRKIRRLSDLQWAFVIETAEHMAQAKPQEERTLFILSALYAMYLRISELVVSERWAPKMNDFKRDQNKEWWFSTVGKGNKAREIAVSQKMLSALKRWRLYLGLAALPSVDDQSPLLPKLQGNGGIRSANQIRNIVQNCFDQSIVRLEAARHHEEAQNLRTATVHWLRHTGISDDVKHRPREHVRDDAGHSSGQTTDLYIDIDRRDRHRSAKHKPLKDKSTP